MLSNTNCGKQKRSLLYRRRGEKGVNQGAWGNRNLLHLGIFAQVVPGNIKPSMFVFPPHLKSVEITQIRPVMDRVSIIFFVFTWWLQSSKPQSRTLPNTVTQKLTLLLITLQGMLYQNNIAGWGSNWSQYQKWSCSHNTFITSCTTWTHWIQSAKQSFHS